MRRARFVPAIAPVHSKMMGERQSLATVMLKQVQHDGKCQNTGSFAGSSSTWRMTSDLIAACLGAAGTLDDPYVGGRRSMPARERPPPASGTPDAPNVGGAALSRGA